MTPFEFLIVYAVGGGVMFAAGWFIGSQRAESRAEQMRRWWFDRQNKQ